MYALILIGLIALAAAAFTGFFFTVRWSLKRLDEHLAEQAATEREVRMRRYSMAPFRGAGERNQS
jgi:hypothetical protein